MNRTSEVARILTKANLTISVDKSHFCMCRITYLGYQLDAETLHADQNRIKPIVQYPIPSSVKQVRSFLGMCGWYRRFIRDFAQISAPLSDLLKGKGTRIKWTEEAARAFEQLKTALSCAVMRQPDFSKRFFIYCDASDRGIGTCITFTASRRGRAGRRQRLLLFETERDNFNYGKRPYHHSSGGSVLDALPQMDECESYRMLYDDDECSVTGHRHRLRRNHPQCSSCITKLGNVQTCSNVNADRTAGAQYQIM